MVVDEEMRGSEAGHANEDGDTIADQLPTIDEIKVFQDVPTRRSRPSTASMCLAVLLPTLCFFLGMAANFFLLGKDSSASVATGSVLRNEKEEPETRQFTTNITATTNQAATVESRLGVILKNEGETMSLEDTKSYRYTAFKRLARQENTYASYSDARLKQAYGLLCLYYATNENGMGWSRTIFWERDYDECRWEGISCDASERVVEIDLNNFGLKGAVPTELALIENVRRIHLDDNPGLDGQIPAVFGLMDLDELTLTGCGYIGEMPDIVCDLKINNAAMVLKVDCLERIACDTVCCESCT